VDGFEFEDCPVKELLLGKGLIPLRMEGEREKVKLMFNIAIEVDLRSGGLRPYRNR